MKQAGGRFEVVPLSQVPRVHAAEKLESAKQLEAKQLEKDEPYATEVTARSRARSGWHAYCKSCELRFALKQQPSQLGADRGRDMWLHCPYCGHLDQYTPADLLRDAEETAVGINRSVQ